MHPFLIFLLGLILFLPSGFLGRWLAEQKGYSTASWFLLCWLCGFPALIIICGAPNRYDERNLNNISERLKHLLENKDSISSTASSAPALPPSARNMMASTWYCKKCREENSLTATFCKSCGDYK